MGESYRKAGKYQSVVIKSFLSYFTYALQLPYTINVETSNSVALNTPTLNISSTGIVPTSVQTFSISLPCTGVVEAEVDVVITVKINNAVGNTTTLAIKRKKICTKNENQAYTLVHVNPVQHRTNSANIFYFAVAFALILIKILTLFVVLYYVRNKKFRRSREDNSGNDQVTFVTTHRNTTNTYGSFRRMPSYSLVDERSKDLQERISELTLQRLVYV